MRSLLRKDGERDRGAVAIVVAILATVLFAAAALSVDLGNAWARKREVQKQVDVSALGAGYLLPMHTGNKAAIADKVATYLSNIDNLAIGQNGSISGSQLINGNAADGEIYFTAADGSACHPDDAAKNDCVRMRVVSPPATVAFGLANVIGESETKVQRAATVEVRTFLAPGDHTLPFWLPNGCGYGPAQADTSQGGGWRWRWRWWCHHERGGDRDDLHRGRRLHPEPAGRLAEAERQRLWILLEHRALRRPAGASWASRAAPRRSASGPSTRMAVASSSTTSPPWPVTATFRPLRWVER